MNISVVILLIFGTIFSTNGLEISDSLDCKGKTYQNVTLAAYFVNFDEDDSSDNVYLDVRGKKLRTLQDYLDEREDFVTIAMDETLKLPYATRVCIPELNYHYGRRLELQVRDIGSDLIGTKFKRADICVRTEEDSYDNIVNRVVTMVF